MSRKFNTVIESIGVYLPEGRVATADVLAGCANHVRLPLERLTGIRSRHVTFGKEFSIDLAVNAVEDCLRRSNFAPEDFDILICANISRYDGPARVSYEPSTAVSLKARFGFDRAVVFDLSNACAGMWSAVYLVDALLRAGSIRRGMVVSGEYISYLAETAQREIVDHLDPQLASLTLGDAGVAISLELSPEPDVGFRDIELYTLSKYSRYCIAKPTMRAPGAVAMYTEVVKVTSAVVPHAAVHAMQVLQRNQQRLQAVKHIIPHQTSRLTMQDAIKEMARRYEVDLSGQLVNNLAERGNTATTSHFLALRDCIVQNRVQSGDDILFLISGSGQTTGTALYTCDDLPDRMRRKPDAAIRTAGSRQGVHGGETLPVTLAIEAAAFAHRGCAPPDTLQLLKTAVLRCLDKSRYSKEDIQLLLSVGVYRSEFVTEPAMAALLAGELAINDCREPDDERRTLAFDLLNGSIGFLNACYLAAELARTGAIERTMVVASEVENNAHVAGVPLLGFEEIGTAAILHESEDGETGFQAFSFNHFPEYADAFRVDVAWTPAGLPFLTSSRAAGLHDIYLDCIESSVRGFLHSQNLTRDDFKLLLAPQISGEFIDEVGRRLGFPPSGKTNATISGKDLATSSTPMALLAALDSGEANTGDLALIVNVGAGIQVGCAIYRF
jgi:3-oxoacyl-[acyl-carrier-protein] synthase III